MLGQIITHDIVRPNGILRTVDELNNLDRYELAEFAVQKIDSYRWDDLLKGNYDRNQLIEDVARHIDKILPQSYIKWKTKRHDVNPSRLNENISDYGLIYYFDKEVTRPKKKIVVPKVIKLIDASEIVELERFEDAVVDVEVPPEDNYTLLINYLNEHSLRLGGDNRFKAILSAMNGMTEYGKTKEKAVKDASLRYGVPQTYIRDLISKMGIKSKRSLASKKNYAQQMSATAALKKRLEREYD